MKMVCRDPEAFVRRCVQSAILIALAAAAFFAAREEFVSEKNASSLPEVDGYHFTDAGNLHGAPAWDSEYSAGDDRWAGGIEKDKAGCMNGRATMDRRMNTVCSVRSKLERFIESGTGAESEVMASINFDFWVCARAKSIRAETPREERLDECDTAGMSSAEFDMEAALAAMPPSKERDGAYLQWLIAKKSRIEMVIMSASLDERPEIDSEIRQEFFRYDATNAKLDALLTDMSRYDPHAVELLEALEWKRT